VCNENDIVILIILLIMCNESNDIKYVIILIIIMCSNSNNENEICVCNNDINV